MAKTFKELPTDPQKLRELLKILKDKEMKLEADLAIRDQPDLEEGITKIVLAMSEVRKMDEAMRKSDKPVSPEDQKAVEALISQRNFYQGKADTLTKLILEKGGREAEKFAEVVNIRREYVNQLQKVYHFVSDKFEQKGINLRNLVPSLADFLDESAGEVKTPVGPEVLDSAKTTLERIVEEQRDNPI